MELSERVNALADRLVAVIPESPTLDDATSYLAWREVVWAAALGIARLVGGALTELGLVASSDDETFPGEQLSARQLLRLALSIRHDLEGDLDVAWNAAEPRQA
ncbi:MAG: hypothetical protein JWQ19_3805 [Subtercola sp.]|nr:hypothetical protein [Subtercola sp.]